jgi:hypothetical protein
MPNYTVSLLIGPSDPVLNIPTSDGRVPLPPYKSRAPRKYRSTRLTQAPVRRLQGRRRPAKSNHQYGDLIYMRFSRIANFTSNNVSPLISLSSPLRSVSSTTTTLQRLRPLRAL